MTGERKRKLLFDVLTPLAALAVGFVVVFPILYGLFGAFKTAPEFSSYPPAFFPESFAHLDNFAEALAMMPFWRYMLNSFIVAAISSVARLGISILAAYAFTFYDFRGKKFLFFFLLATMMFPGDTLLVANYLTVVKMNLLDTYFGMCITSFVGAAQMFMLRQKFLSVPRDLVNAAEIDGCGDFRFITRILLPITKPVIITLLVQSFIGAWNAYLWPLLVTNTDDMRTVQVGVSMLTSLDSANYHLVLAGVTLTLLPSLVLFAVMRASISKDTTAGALVG